MISLYKSWFVRAIGFRSYNVQGLKSSGRHGFSGGAFKRAYAYSYVEFYVR